MQFRAGWEENDGCISYVYLLYVEETSKNVHQDLDGMNLVLYCYVECTCQLRFVSFICLIPCTVCN